MIYTSLNLMKGQNMTPVITIPERDEEHERILAVVFNLAPSQAVVLSCILRSVAVTTEQLTDYAGTKSHIKIAISRARTRLREHGFDIVSKNNVGYWIEPEVKRGIEARIGEYLNVDPK